MISTSDLPSTSAEQRLAEIYRSEWGRILSLLVTRSRRLDLAEDALGEAFARATASWPDRGVPHNPGGWLYTTAWRQLIAGLRSEAIRGRTAPLVAVDRTWGDHNNPGEFGDFDDERLALILLCCHPALHPHARSPLALRMVVGTTTAEIARLFLVPTPTMAARITRAKKKIVTVGIPLSAPVDEELKFRLDDVCRTVYLAFTAGYTPGAGPDLLRTDLAGDAVYLASILYRLVPDAPQVQALYALLVLQHARRSARVHNGELVTLGEQDRSSWHQDELALGRGLISAIPGSTGYAEELRLQGLIAAEHASASTAAATDWTAITAIYAQLEALTLSPVVRLNRAVAVAECQGPSAGLQLLEGLDALLPTNHRVPAVRAELATRAGDTDLAAASYLSALKRCTNETERRFLQRKLNALR